MRIYFDVSVPTVHEKHLKDALDKWDIIRTEDPDVYEFYRSSPGGVPTQLHSHKTVTTQL
ncbi:hypothetical protein ABVN80_19515 [Acinetobacter baumannii]